MNRKVILGVMLMALFVATTNTTVCQNDLGDNRGTGECLSSATLLSFLHLSFGEAFDRLDSMDFKLGDLGDLSPMVYDTIEYFTLAYKQSIFFNKYNKGCYIIFKESMDGLGNIIEYSLTPKGTCNVVAELNSHNYVYNKERSSYGGSRPINGRIERFEIVVRQDYSLWMKCMRTDDIPEFISRKRDTAKATIARTTQQALDLAADERFSEAYALLDTMLGYYPPLDVDLEKCRESITKQREEMYEYRLSGAVELMDYPLAIRLCDTILSINPNNSKVQHIKELIYAQLSQQSQHYKMLRPNSFDSIHAQLSEIVNTYIRQHPSADDRYYQQLKMQFHLYTNRTNESKGIVELKSEVSSPRLARQEKERQDLLQQAIDSVAASPLIQPIVDNGIYVIAQDSLSTDVKWIRSILTIDGDEVRDTAWLVKKYIDSIERAYFYHAKNPAWDRTSDGKVKVAYVPALPTKRVYTFSLTQKECFGDTCSDIYLTGFETTTADSWMPSLLIPGLGTYMQNARGDVSSRAIPFFLFAGISIGGFIYQNHSPEANQEGATWGQQNVGRIVGFSAAGISTAIYFTDLFEAIGNCFKNAKRSKTLRKKMREDGFITCQEKDIPVVY